MSLFVIVFFFKQKTAYEMRISDWGSDVCSSELAGERHLDVPALAAGLVKGGRVIKDSGYIVGRLRRCCSESCDAASWSPWRQEDIEEGSGRCRPCGQRTSRPPG